MFNERIECTGENLSYINDYLIRLAAHYTDSYASDIVYIINSIEEQLQKEHFQEMHRWFLCFYKSGIQKEDNLETVKNAGTRAYRAVHSYTVKMVGNNGFKEPQITVERVINY